MPAWATLSTARSAEIRRFHAQTVAPRWVRVPDCTETLLATHTRTGVADIMSTLRTFATRIDDSAFWLAEVTFFVECGRRPSSRRAAISVGQQPWMFGVCWTACPAFPSTTSNLFGHNAPGLSWLSADSLPHFAAHTGDNSAGNGGNGHFAGSMIDTSYAAFEPLNVAQAGSHATANAYQTNIVYLDQSATQIAGVGGDGGNGNAASGGNVGAFGSVPGRRVGTGDNSAGNGGDGYFSGSMVHAPVAVYSPINIAVAGPNATADAHQTNVVYFDQSATQMAGVGGDGGNGNAASGGHVGRSDPSPASSLARPVPVTTAPAMVATETPMAAWFTRASRFTIRSTSRWPDTIPAPTPSRPTTWCSINPRIRWPASAAMAGTAMPRPAEARTCSLPSSDLIGSDVIATGHNSAGNGGDGHFSGNLVDINVAIYAPINIAVAGYNSTAEATQSNHVQFDQSAIQIAGVGGDGGHGNTALGGDLAMHCCRTFTCWIILPDAVSFSIKSKPRSRS